MCEAKNHYNEYSRAEEILRRFGISKDLPGFEYLRTATVIVKLDGFKPEEELLKEIEKQCFIVRSEFVKKHPPVKQHMIEAIRSVSKSEQKLTIEEFLKRVVADM